MADTFFFVIDEQNIIVDVEKVIERDNVFIYYFFVGYSFFSLGKFYLKEDKKRGFELKVVPINSVDISLMKSYGKL